MLRKNLKRHYPKCARATTAAVHPQSSSGGGEASVSMVATATANQEETKEVAAGSSGVEPAAADYGEMAESEGSDEEDYEGESEDSCGYDNEAELHIQDLH